MRGTIQLSSSRTSARDQGYFIPAIKQLRQNYLVTPSKAGIQLSIEWIPAYAGMTVKWCPQVITTTSPPHPLSGAKTAAKPSPLPLSSPLTRFRQAQATAEPSHHPLSSPPRRRGSSIMQIHYTCRNGFPPSRE